ncbi:hypothetical protein X777_08793 [Ooceraea biroi]|uniref:Odorant receptor n=1 Tax=Ooceraea biroi TaxID=2015173 RepID=A0A026W6E5_OOCBI|nr:hypothetical protein X777_08793 [Ooceraea biroi]
MICIKKRFFNLNRLLLLPFGLWLEETKFNYFQATLFCSLIMSSIVFQITSLFNQLQYIYDRLKDRNEIAIYNKYGYIAKYFTTIVITILVCGLFANSVIVYWPYILDAVMPKNESYAIHTMKLVTKYFEVSEKYYFLVLVHLNAACTAGLIILTGVGTLLISYMKHICGMFEIASYRIEQAMAIELLHNFDIKKFIVMQKIICAVNIQRYAMNFIDCFMTTLEGTVLALIIVTVICMSVTLFRIFQIVSLEEEVEEVILHLFSVLILLVVMFITNYIGQQVTDYSNHIYIITYNASWYLAPIRIQKLILFLLQRSNKIFTLSVGGLFTASLECFTTLVSASVSYFTFMYSIQQ